ncbi:MAG: general stress protein [Afipia sp. 62-7]|nr:pyridoxamine 5'-phosphate oxidase family protein [Afipia sp.]OJU17063.1 MAG: general stress protein [Afipia sp. 62-7]
MATTTNDADRVWELAQKISIAMLTGWDGHNLHSRPMGAHVVPDENAFYFLADRRHHKDDDIRNYPTVCLAFADPGSQTYVSITGEAAVSGDRGKIKELWNVWAKAWWDSPDDPNICVLKVTPREAEYWDAPGKIVSSVKMAVAAATGNRPDMGENRKVAM